MGSCSLERARGPFDLFEDLRAVGLRRLVETSAAGASPPWLRPKVRVSRHQVHARRAVGTVSRLRETTRRDYRLQRQAVL